MQADIADQEIDAPARRNSIICPCCLQFVDDVNILVDSVGCQIANGTKTIKLSRQQFNVAKYLIDCYPRMAEKGDLYSNVLLDEHGEGPEMKIIDVLVCKIRPALADIGLVVETVWGKGYKIVMADASEGNAIKDMSIRIRKPGSAQRWLPEHDETLLDLIRRKHKVAACASIMKMPFMAVERHYKRLLSLA
ncbi:winged helix-turn-helix domain-containing protein [Rhizobium ruizarguesonis]|uniref:winged helix-turn-helix domain-containing protein n=1 Tax=Rhizobium ruizarguesonis TaxID=2081791 RepID=UPI0013EF5428|nr:winged helix-turn-helix domain-containing protein [Rhizobium ruizarguesonis]